MGQYDRGRLPIERPRRSNGRSKLGITIWAIAAILLVMNLRDIYRYLKISNM